jgi:hypothetical protein
MKRFLSVIVLAITCMAVVGAAGRSNAKETSVPSIAHSWTGTTQVTTCGAVSSTRCNAVNNITFDFVPTGKHIKGKFTCAHGTMNCRNGGADDSGKIVSGKLSGKMLRLSVMVPADVSHCIYNGRLTSSTTIRGAYACYEGGGLVEQGAFDLTKASD